MLKVLPRSWRVQLLKNALLLLKDFPRVNKISYPTEEKFEAVVSFDINKDDTFQERQIKVDNRVISTIKEFDIILDFEKELNKIFTSGGFVTNFIKSQNQDSTEYNKVFSFRVDINNNVLVIKG